MIDVETREFICPQPRIWNEVHARLAKACQLKGIDPSGLPVPLILDGWWYSSDAEKRTRWDATVTWALAQNLADAIPALNSDSGYCGGDQ